jgi:hypothetical protein
MKGITYAIDLETGLVWSRFNHGQLAIPVLDFAGMKPENNWEMNFDLQKFNSTSMIGANLKWTKKIPIEIKNLHRQFWGMPKLVQS